MLDEVNARVLEKDPQAHPGSAMYLRHLQSAITEVMHQQTKEKLQEFEAVAAARNAAGLDPDVQAK
jgi:hypothetical protein